MRRTQQRLLLALPGGARPEAPRDGTRCFWCWTTAPVTRARPAARPSPSVGSGCAWYGLSRYSPHLNLKEEREWRYLKRDARSHLLADSLREFVDGILILAGLTRLGGARLDIVDRVAGWFIAGHSKEPTGRPPGRPKGAKDSRPRKSYERKNLPAAP